MDPITLITGSPGTGKTAVSGLLAARNPRGVHIPSDIFYTFPAHPIPPHLAAADAQNQAVIASALHAAAALARRGYEVFFDGIFGPWFLPFIASEFAQHAGRYVRHIVETEALPPDGIAGEILQRREDGDFLLDL